MVQIDVGISSGQSATFLPRGADGSRRAVALARVVGRGVLTAERLGVFNSSVSKCPLHVFN